MGSKPATPSYIVLSLHRALRCRESPPKPLPQASYDALYVADRNGTGDRIKLPYRLAAAV